MIKLSELMWYERLDEALPFWFLNQINSKIENSDEITARLDVSVNYFINNCYYYNYIPFPFIDIRKIEKDYLVVLNNRQISEHLNRIPENKFGYEFGRIFHCGFEYEHWIEYYKQQKKAILITWCKANKIPYIDDMTNQSRDSYKPLKK